MCLSQKLIYQYSKYGKIMLPMNTRILEQTVGKKIFVKIGGLGHYRAVVPLLKISETTRHMTMEFVLDVKLLEKGWNSKKF